MDFIVQCLVNSLEIIENNIEIKALPQFPYAVKRMQIEPFVLDVPPEAFGEYIVKGASATVHAYGHPCFFSNLVNASNVNWAPWSVLKISGLP